MPCRDWILLTIGTNSTCFNDYFPVAVAEELYVCWRTFEASGNIPFPNSLKARELL